MLNTRTKDFVALAATTGAVAVVGLLAHRFIGNRGWIPTASVAMAAAALLLLEIYRRLQTQLKEAAREQLAATRVLYDQTAALLSVLNTTRPTFPLPVASTWAASPDLLNKLCALVLARQPEHVFEVGSGVSTLTVAYCLRRLGKGRMTSLESDARFAAATREMLSHHGLIDLVTIVDAPLKDVGIGNERWTWYDEDRIPTTPPIDLLFVDGPHGLTQRLARYPALPVLFGRMSPNSMIILDDGARADETEVASRWAREFGLTSEFLELQKGAYVFTRKS
jgi:predicted O-methyltransferase YrrM